MYKYIFLFIIFFSLTSFSTVSAYDEQPGDTLPTPSFIETNDKTDDDDNQDNKFTGGYGVEKIEVVCRKTQPTPVVKFVAQVVFQGVDEDKVEVSNFIARCNADSDLAEAKIEILVRKEWWRTLRDVISGKEANTTLSKDARCKVTDKILTFYLKDDAKEIGVICGNPDPDDGSNGRGGGVDGYGGGYGGGSGQYYQQQPPYAPPQQPPYQQPQQPPVYGAGQQYPYYSYDSGWQDYDSGWSDFTEETAGVFDDGDVGLLDDGWGNNWDDGWGESDSTDVVGEPSDGSGLYGSVTDIVDFGNGPDEVSYPDYGEQQLYREPDPDDPIGSLINTTRFFINQDNGNGEWGVLDPEYSELPIQDLLRVSTYEEFKRYYSGEVSRQEWESLRSWIFAHNRNNFKYEISFYNTASQEQSYSWYNPYRWWRAFSGWITEANPLNTKYDI